MIVKSMARKVPTFGQLIGYIARDAEAGSPVFTRNLCHEGFDEVLTARQFKRNFSELPKRKNGNALYHEVIVLERQRHLAKPQVNDALIDLAERYCEMRAPGQLAWGRIHANTANPHIHLMISSNDVRSTRRVRLEKSAFAKIQIDLERYREAEHPELSGGRIYDRKDERETPHISRKEGEAIRRTGQPSRKQEMAQQLRPIFDTAKSRSDLEAKLKSAGITLYKRGKSWGVIDENGHRYRLQTLGLSSTFDRAVQRSQEVEETQLVEIELPEPEPSHKEPHDPRAAALLSRREALEEIARDELGHAKRDNIDRI